MPFLYLKIKKGVALHTTNVYNILKEGMKTKEFIRLLENNGWSFIRHGGNHDIYTNGKEREAVPRHKEIDEELVRAIIKRRNLR